MSGMADEMRARMEADGGAGLANGGDGGAAPGNEGRQPEPPAPPAGESNADTAGSQGTPDTIPYSRFKEVNDQLATLRPFEELVGYGYDADSLRRLATFEAGYLADPVGTVRSLAENVDLPQHILDAIDAHVASTGGDGGRAGGEPSGDDPQPAALPAEVQKRLDYVDQLQQREVEQQQEAQLQAVVEAWNALDKKDGIETPPKIQLMAIAQTAAAGGDWQTFEDLAKAAREDIVGYRNATLGSAVQGTGRGGTPPPALPGGAPPASAPIKFGSLKEASKAAEADIRAGRIPSL